PLETDVEYFRTIARSFGFEFAVDDFGQGYSQLKSLYDYEPDILKIDRFFVKDIAHDTKKQLFVRTVVELAHAMGMLVVGEGIETQQELVACRKIGCDLLQGFYIARPKPIPVVPIHVYDLEAPGSEKDAA
ncbi:MAG: EAL domain-containing protein, partial [Pseudomonadota bacterium]